MDGLFFACALVLALVMFAAVAVFRGSEARDAIDRLEGRTLPLAPWTHHD